MIRALFSSANAETFRQALLKDEALAQLARGWTVSVALVVQDPEQKAAAVSLRLEDGKVVSLEAVEDPKSLAAEYVLVAPEGVWRGVLAGQLDPVGAVFSGKLKVTQGNVMALASRVPALRRLLEVAQSLATQVA